MKYDIGPNQAKTEATLKEMNEEITTRMEARIDASNKSLRSFDILSSPGWIST